MSFPYIGEDCAQIWPEFLLNRATSFPSISMLSNWLLLTTCVRLHSSFSHYISLVLLSVYKSSYFCLRVFPFLSSPPIYPLLFACPSFHPPPNLSTYVSAFEISLVLALRFKTISIHCINTTSLSVIHKGSWALIILSLFVFLILHFPTV